MKYARIIHKGKAQNAAERDGQLILEDATLVSFDAVTWLPPLADARQPRTILAVGMNYAPAGGHAMKPPQEPPACLKGQGTLTGHRQFTRRPANAHALHDGCALAAVIGKAARSVRADDAYEFVAGYTVANDYTVRDPLDDGQSASLRAKSRDAATPLGPWFVEASDIADPMALAMTTTVNGKLTHSGNTRDMIFGLPSLIEYFSSFMTLRPGDLIITGISAGMAVDCLPGDVVVTEIEGLGALMNTIS